MTAYFHIPVSLNSDRTKEGIHHNFQGISVSILNNFDYLYIFLYKSKKKVFSPLIPQINIYIYLYYEFNVFLPIKRELLAPFPSSTSSQKNISP